MKENDNNKNKSPINYEHTARLRTVVEDKKSAKDKLKDRLHLDKKKRSKKAKKQNKPNTQGKQNFQNKKRIKMSTAYRNKYIALGVVVLAVFIIAYQFVKVRDVNFDALSKNISKTINVADFNRGTEHTLRKLYGINNIEYENFLSYAPKSNMQASEILVIKCKPEYAKDVMNKIQARVDSQSNSFKNYAKDQYQIIAGAELKKKGDYIYFVSSKNLDQIDNAINKSCK